MASSKPADLAGSLPRLVEVEPLIPDERNSRTHSREQIEQIKASFRQFGFVGIIAYRGTGLKIGHARRQAALEMWGAGETVMGPGRREALPKGQLPAIDLAGLSDADVRALVIADNKLALNAGWDEGVLRSELEALLAIDFPMPVLGFDTSELAGLFAAGKKRDPDHVPPPPAVPISRPGDVWALGPHRLVCGDATDPAVVALVTGGRKMALLLTDPPYGIGYEYREHDDTDAEANADLVAAVFALAPKAKVWTPGKMNLARDLTRFGEARMAIWHKGFAAAGNGMGGASTLEPVLILDPPKRNLANDYLHFGTDREEIGGQSLRDLHPCPKPVALYAHLLEAFCPAGGHVYEPFSGSGTTLIACETRGCICHAVEIDPAYVDVAVQRWEGFTGKEATGPDGRSFAMLGLERAEA